MSKGVLTDEQLQTAASVAAIFLLQPWKNCELLNGNYGEDVKACKRDRENTFYPKYQDLHKGNLREILKRKIQGHLDNDGICVISTACCVNNGLDPILKASLEEAKEEFTFQCGYVYEIRPGTIVRYAVQDKEKTRTLMYYNSYEKVTYDYNHGGVQCTDFIRQKGQLIFDISLSNPLEAERIPMLRPCYEKGDRVIIVCSNVKHRACAKLQEGGKNKQYGSVVPASDAELQACGLAFEGEKECVFMNKNSKKQPLEYFLNHPRRRKSLLCQFM